MICGIFTPPVSACICAGRRAVCKVCVVRVVSAPSPSQIRCIVVLLREKCIPSTQDVRRHDTDARGRKNGKKSLIKRFIIRRIWNPLTKGLDVSRCISQPGPTSSRGVKTQQSSHPSQLPYPYRIFGRGQPKTELSRAKSEHDKCSNLDIYNWPDKKSF